MSKLVKLIKISALNSFGFNQARHSRDRKDRAKLVGFGVLFGFVALSMLFVISFYNLALAQSLEQIHASMRILPALMMAICCLITLITTVYKTNGLLFAFKDYDILMAMPIKTSTIVASRILMMYGMNLAFNSIVMIPTAVVYGIKAAPPLFFYPVFLLGLLAIPMVPIILATIVGVIITVISSRFRHSSAVSVILTLLLLLGVMAISMQMETVLTDFGNISIALMATVNHIYPLAELFTQAVCDLNFLSLVLFVGISLAAFLLFSLVVGHWFKKINTMLTTQKASSHYKLVSLKASSPMLALYRKELKRFLSSPLYILNTSIGVILMMIGSVALIVFDPTILSGELPGVDIVPFLHSAAPYFFCFMLGMSCSSCASISLEGNHLWIIKSLPVQAHTIFLSKAGVTLSYSLPGVAVSTVLLTIALQLNIGQALMLFLLPVTYAFFISLFGLLVNLFLPNFTWKSEITVIKQSAPVFICIMVGMLTSILLAVPVFTITSVSPLLIMGLETVCIILVDLLLWHTLKTKGAAMLRAM